MEVKKTISKTRKTKPQLTEKQKKALKALKLLEELKGSGKGIWNEDAQEYVNRLRSNDRF